MGNLDDTMGKSDAAKALYLGLPWFQDKPADAACLQKLRLPRLRRLQIRIIQHDMFSRAPYISPDNITLTTGYSPFMGQKGDGLNRQKGSFAFGERQTPLQTRRPFQKEGHAQIAESELVRSHHRPRSSRTGNRLQGICRPGDAETSALSGDAETASDILMNMNEDNIFLMRMSSDLLPVFRKGPFECSVCFFFLLSPVFFFFFFFF